MLGKITELWKKLWESIPVFRNKDKVKSPHVPMVEELPSDDTASNVSSLQTGASESICMSTVEAVEKKEGKISNTQISNSTSDKDKQVILDDDEAWKEFFKSQNDPSTNTTNPKPFARGKNKYNGKDITGKIADQIKAEIFKSIENNIIKSIRLKEAKMENDIVYPSVRIVLNDSTKEVNVTKLLSGNICKKYNVKTVTFCHSNQEKKRGACCYINDNGERVYEIINGSYNMTLSWYAKGKECKININDDGTIRLLEGNGITEEQLHANKEVKVGKKCEAKFLHEALASQLPQTQLQQSSEVLSQPLNATDVSIAQKKSSSCCLNE